MRLTCPNCGAQYEIPETAIPEAGRDVQCSACGETWAQQRPDAALTGAEPAPSAKPDAAPVAHAPTEPAPRRLDPGVADILRTEAARERAQRAAEATGDLGPRHDPAPASRKGRLPDMDKIGSSLTPTRAQPERAPPKAVFATSIHAAHSGFRAGFWVAVIGFGLATCVYLAAPDLVALVPKAEAPVERYVAAIDGARLRLDALVDRMVTQISGG